MGKSLKSLAAALLSIGAVTIVAPASAADGGLVQEVRFGVLYHDVPNLWSTFQLERGGVDINAELLLRPALSVFGGTIRPVVGGSVFTGRSPARYSVRQPRAVPHPVRDRFSFRRPFEPVDLFRAHVEQEPGVAERRAGRPRPQVRLPVLRLADSRDPATGTHVTARHTAPPATRSGRRRGHIAAAVSVSRRAGRRHASPSGDRRGRRGRWRSCRPSRR